mgnify:CR=1 FL=1
MNGRPLPALWFNFHIVACLVSSYNYCRVASSDHADYAALLDISSTQLVNGATAAADKSALQLLTTGTSCIWVYAGTVTFYQKFLWHTWTMWVHWCSFKLDKGNYHAKHLFFQNFERFACYLIIWMWLTTVSLCNLLTLIEYYFNNCNEAHKQLNLETWVTVNSTWSKVLMTCLLSWHKLHAVWLVLDEGHC